MVQEGLRVTMLHIIIDRLCNQRSQGHSLLCESNVALADTIISDIKSKLEAKYGVQATGDFSSDLGNTVRPVSKEQTHKTEDGEMTEL